MIRGVPIQIKELISSVENIIWGILASVIPSITELLGLTIHKVLVAILEQSKVDSISFVRESTGNRVTHVSPCPIFIVVKYNNDVLERVNPVVHLDVT